jgi:uroporphyrinogen decarboxylase
MTYKERVLRSLNHKETDRVPFIYRDVSEIRARFKRDLNLATDEELFRYLDIDFRWVEPKYIGKPLNLPNGNKKAIWGVEWKSTWFSDGAGYWNEVAHPLADASESEQLEEYPWPLIEDWDFSTLEKQCDEFSDYAIMTALGPISPGILQTPIQPLIGNERSYAEPLINPVFFQKLIDNILQFQFAFIDKMFSSANGKIDFFRIGDDFGTQQGLLFNIDIFNTDFHIQVIP